MVIAKLHKDSYGRLLLAVCDKKLLGKRFEEKGKVLDLSSDFYNGNEISEDKLRNLCKGAYIINAVGEKSVSIAIELGLAEKSDALKIKKIPHIQIMR